MANLNLFSSVFWFEPGWEEKQFKKVPEGWLMPGPWLFSKSYLVSDEEKAELTICIRCALEAFWGRANVALTLMCAGFLLVLVVLSAGYPNLTVVLLFFGGFVISICVLLGVAVWGAINYWLRIRTVLAGLSRTTQKFSWAERFKINAMLVSRNFWIVQIIDSIVFALALYWMVMSDPQLQQSYFFYLWVAAGGSLLILSVAMLVVKSKMTSGQTSS